MIPSRPFICRFTASLCALSVIAGSPPLEAQHPCTAQDGSSQLFEHRQGGPIECVFFENASEGWTGEEGGRLRHTTMGGANWHFHYLDDSALIHDVYFLPAPNDDFGWAVGGQGTIFRTTNGGDCWDTVRGPSMGNPVLDGGGTPVEMFMVNFEPGTGGNHFGMAVGRQGTLLLSSDAGQTWAPASLSTFADLYAVTRTSGAWHVAGDRFIFKSTDDGVTWTGTDLNPFGLVCAGLNEPYPEVWDLAFVDDQKGFAAGGTGFQCGFILATNDGGDTWVSDCYDIEPRNLPIGWDHMTTIYGLSAFQTTPGDCSDFRIPNSEAATVGYGGQLFLRHDPPGFQICLATLDASYWRQWTPPMAKPPLKDVGGFGADIWYCGQFGLLRNTNDCGTSFYDAGTETPRRLSGGTFFDNDLGYVVGQGPAIFETTNGGFDWVETVTGSGSGDGLAVAVSPDGTAALAVGQANWAQSKDGTNPWAAMTLVSIPSGLTITDVAFKADSSEAYAIGSNAQNGSILLKASSMNNWALLEHVMTFNGIQLHGIDVEPNGTIYLVGLDGAAYEVTGGGANANSITVPMVPGVPNPDLVAVATNGTETWAVGKRPNGGTNPGIVYKLSGASPNLTFVEETTAITSPLAYEAVGFDGSSNLLVGGVGGELQSYDGSTWTVLDSNTNSTIKDISYPAAGTHGFLIGRQFNINVAD